MTVNFRPATALVAMIAACALAVPLLLLTVVGAEAATSTVYKAGNGVMVKQRLRYAVAHLAGAPGSTAGYNRDLFKLWTDADRDCQNTRAEVLKVESRVATTGACTVRTGKWISYYDGFTFRDASQLDIDHVVPLAEAWASGARKWTFAKREAYANDLADSRTLVGVSAHANRSKGDSDPARWMPSQQRCRYITQWTTVKLRWGLSVNPVERRTLTRWANSCPNALIAVRRGTVLVAYRHTTTTGGTSGGSGGGSGSSGTDPRFATCADAKAAGYGPYYRSSDPEYIWYRDADSDGIVCE